MDAFAAVIGILAMLVGGIVVANTMMMSIYERTREIGTLRALGWPKRSILSQVVQESLWLCLVAGVLGSVLGVVMLWGISKIPMADADDHGDRGTCGHLSMRSPWRWVSG